MIATKGGIHWGGNGERIVDGRPATLRRECEESLRRLGVEHVDLLYLHAPDPAIPLRESAGELRRLMAEGKTNAGIAKQLWLAENTVVIFLKSSSALWR